MGRSIIASFKKAGSTTQEEEDVPKHIARLLAVLVVAAVLAYAAKQFFTPASFYQYGHYRGDSVAEIASDKPKYGTPKNCERCHAAIYAKWSQGVHHKPEQGKIVKCEVCHGPSSSRDVKGLFDNVATGDEHPAKLKMSIPVDRVRQCTLCHEKMPGRPAEQRQIDIEAHAGKEPCTLCHDPHAPRDFAFAPAASRKGDAAKGRALAGDCAACHGEAGVSLGDPGPSLAGQKESYLAAALKAYRKDGGRSNEMMQSVVENATDASMENLAAYFAGLNCKSAGDGDRAAVAAGKALSARCSLCHGTAGVSRLGVSPSLAGISREHLQDALKSYQDGRRSNAVMIRIAKELKEQEVAALASYYANASCK